MSTDLRSLLMSRAEPKPASRRAGMRRLLEASWDTLWQVLGARLPGVVVEALAQVAKDSDPHVAKPAKQVMARDRRFVSEYEQALRVEYLQAIDEFVRGQPEEGREAEAAGGKGRKDDKDNKGDKAGLGAGLALVDYGDMELQTLIEASASRLRNAADDIYSSLCTRLANAVREAEIRPGESPFKPAMFFRALHVALTKLDALSADQVLEVMPRFDGPLARPIIDAYAAIDEQLSARGHGNELSRMSISRNSVIGRTTRQGSGTQGGGAGGIGGAKAEQILEALYNRLQLVPEGQPSAAMPVAPPGTTLVAVPSQLGLDGLAGLQTGQFAVAAAHSALAAATAGVQPVAVAAPVVTAGPTVALPGAPMAIGVDLLNAINEIQKLGALALSAIQLGQPAPDAAIGTSELRHRLMDKTTDQVDRLTIEIVGLLFERINADRHVPQPIKDLLQRLQFPLIKVAVTDPGLFVQADQPARRLMDRIASTSIGWTGAGEANERYLAEVQKAVYTVLAAGDEGIGAFSRALEQFETFLGDERNRDDDPVQRAKRALAEAEEREIMVINATIRIRNAFDGVQVESYLRDFLLDAWVRVLVTASQRKSADAMRHYLSIVPDLVWSVQPKLGQDDRRRLVGTIPTVLGVLREGLLLIEWPKERMQAFFGKLMNSHAQAVKALELAHGSPGVPFEPSTMRIKLDGIRLDDIDTAPLEETPLRVPDEQVQQALVQAQADVEHLMPPEASSQPPAENAPPPATLDERIAAFKRGDWFNLRLGDVVERVQLRWISPRKTLYLFVPAENRSGHSLSPETLRAYLARGDLVPVEAEPLFDRAVHDVIQGLQRSAVEPAASA